ncbi:MAG TPA: NAD(P)-binding domain-containing protein [Gemmatimonadales bacterium]|jgi:predicted dinucleotide-binding enzyme
MTKVGILGSAVVGQTLAQGFKQHGYEVRIGSRTPAKLASFTESSGIPAGTFEAVGAWGELLVLAVHGMAAQEALILAGAKNHRGKIVIDTTNPLTRDPPVDGVVKVFTGPNESLLERLQAAFPETRLVKAFNSVGSARMVNPVYAGGRPTMFFCGNDAEAKAAVAEILKRFGWDPADMGTAAGARAIEPLCQLWCIPGFRENHWTHAFKLLWD